jgi:hypothetical protein
VRVVVVCAPGTCVLHSTSPPRPPPALQLLQDSLCGSSKVLLLCCIAGERDALGTLNYGRQLAQVDWATGRKVGLHVRVFGEGQGGCIGRRVHGADLAGGFLREVHYKWGKMPFSNVALHTIARLP